MCSGGRKRQNSKLEKELKKIMALSVSVFIEMNVI